MPRISAILEARRERIERSLDQADELKAQAEQVRQEFEVILASARNKAHEHVMHMIHNVSVTTAQRKRDLNAIMISRIQSSEARIARQRIQAVDEIKIVAEQASIETVEKLINQKIDPQHAGDIVNQLFSQKVA